MPAVLASSLLAFLRAPHPLHQMYRPALRRSPLLGTFLLRYDGLLVLFAPVNVHNAGLGSSSAVISLFEQPQTIGA